MPTKSLYIKDSDLPLWERAQKELGVNMSELMTDCLKEKLERVETTITEDKAGAMGKITVTLWNANEQPNIKKSFTGRWLVRDVAAEADENSSWGTILYSVALTKNLALAIHEFEPNDHVKPSLTVYEDFHDFSTDTDGYGHDRYPQNLIAEVAAALEIPYEIEMDI